MKSKITMKTAGIISCATLLTLALAGGVFALTMPATTNNSEQSVAEQNLFSQNENYIGETEAKAIALAHAGLAQADVSQMICKLDYDDGVAEYEVEFWDGTTEYDYEINAVSGAIISYDYDMESYDGTAVTPPTTTDYIGEVKAISIALAHAGVLESEAGFIKCEFDIDDGRAEYEVEWQIGRTEYEYTISATDGAIWEHDVDYDD